MPDHPAGQVRGQAHQINMVKTPEASYTQPVRQSLRPADYVMVKRAGSGNYDGLFIVNRLSTTAYSL